VHKVLTNRKFPYESVELFWQAIIQEELRPGDIIKIKDGFLTDWIPRVPGEAWNNFKDKGSTINLDSTKKGGHFTSSGIYQKNPTHFGSIRLPFGQNSTNFAMLSITTYDCWSVDLSIPVIVSKEVYNQFITIRKNGQAVEGEIEATLEFGEMPLMNTSLLKAIDSDCSDEFVEYFSTPKGLPRIYLRLSSPLNVKFRANNTHPSGTIWALAEHTQSHEIHYPPLDLTTPNSRPQGNPKAVECDPYSFISLNMAHFNLSEKELTTHYISEFKKGEANPPGYENRSFVNPSEVVRVLTEFDGQKKHFSDSIRMINEPWKRGPEKEKIVSTINVLNNK